FRGAFAADPVLVLDRSLPLQIGRIAGVDGSGAHLRILRAAGWERGAGFVTKGFIIAFGYLARKRTHQFIEPRLARRFRFTPIDIRGAVCHGIEMALAVGRAPRFALARSLVPAASGPFAATN